MGKKALKLEIIHWLSQLEDEDTINFLKIVKDNATSDTDWWNEIPEQIKSGIENSYRDKQQKKIIAHEEVAKKYGLKE
jgi:hypothetical protein